MSEKGPRMTASTCPRCQLRTVRERSEVKKAKKYLRMVCGIMYEMDELVCPRCGFYYLDARPEKNGEMGCETHSCATCGTFEPDEHCMDCTHYPSRSCHWTPRE
jgi:hypothetical protein